MKSSARRMNPRYRSYLICGASEMGRIVFPNHEAGLVWKSANPFEDRHYFKLNGKCDFNYYDNGKSAGRRGPCVTARDAHKFRGYAGQRGLSKSACILTTPARHSIGERLNTGDVSGLFLGRPRLPHPVLFPFEAGRCVPAVYGRGGSIEGLRAVWEPRPE